MTLSPHDHPALEAVDELAEVRAHIERLREREAELCDEIRSFATQTGGMRVCGTSRDAVIEQRRPRRVDLGKLPKEVFLDPNLLIEQTETVVLIWPKTTSAAVPARLPASVADVDTAQIAEVADLHNAASDLPQGDVFETAHMSTELCGLDEITDIDGTPEPMPELDHDLAAAPDMGLAPPTAEMRTIGAPLNEEDPIGDMLDLGARVNDIESGFSLDEVPSDPPPYASCDCAPQSDDVPMDTSDDPFGLKDAVPAQSASAPLEVDEAGAPECAAPRDLRPTAHAHLQPMAGLHEEEVAQALADADTPLDPVTLSDALSEAQTLETQMDLQVELGGVDLSDDLPAAFATSRAISGV